MSTEQAPTQAKMGTLAFTMATWIYALHSRGVVCAMPEVEEACLALDQGGPMEQRGQALVQALRAALVSEDTLAAQSLAASLFGTVSITTELGASRAHALREARRYQFRQNLPWMACIVDRFPDGHVGEHWVLVESLGEQVRCLDPYPWDDLDETHEQPLVEFMVKWELGGLVGLRYKG